MSLSAPPTAPMMPLPTTPSAPADGLSFSGMFNCFQGTLAQRRACRSKCTVDTCPLVLSYWSYRPNVAINAAFLGIALLLEITLLVQAYRSRGFRMYTVVISIGLWMQIVGYAARIYAYSHPFNDISFILQLSSLTLSPAFFAAGIYLTLTRIVLTVGSGLSRIPPTLIPRLFVAGDVIAITLQAAGGALSAYLATHERMPMPGTYTLVGGLAFQTLILLLFLALAADFYLCAHRGARCGLLNAALAARRLRASARFRCSAAGMAVAAVLVFERSVYRIAELSEGWKGALMSSERFVVLFESVPVAVAGLLLAALHPGFCFRAAAAEAVARPGGPARTATRLPAYEEEEDAEKRVEKSWWDELGFEGERDKDNDAKSRHVSWPVPAPVGEGAKKVSVVVRQSECSES